MHLHLLHLSGITNIGFYKNNLVTGSVALMDFITYLVTKINFIKSNIGDPTLEIWLKNEANVDG